MKTTTCSKCRVTTNVRNPECDGWTSTPLPKGSEYVDLCPKCSKEFEKVKDGAWNTFHATIEAWLGMAIESETTICDEAVNIYLRKHDEEQNEST